MTQGTESLNFTFRSVNKTKSLARKEDKISLTAFLLLDPATGILQNKSNLPQS